jgi:Pyridoxamine 5'-phosphate oxidase
MEKKKQARAFDQTKPYDPGSSVLSQEELREFLASPDSKWLIKIAFLDEDGWPRVVPVWYQWDGEHFLVVGRRKSDWVQRLKVEPRCAICIEEKETPPAGANRKVLAQCTAEVVEGPVVAEGSKWLPVANEMAVRYLGPNGADLLAPSHQWERYLVKLTPRGGKLTTWQGTDWHKRYFKPGQRPDLEK